MNYRTAIAGWKYAREAVTAIGVGGTVDTALGKQLFDEFRADNTDVNMRLTREREVSRELPSQLVWRSGTIIVGITLAAFVVALLAAKSISHSLKDPLESLRRVVEKQRYGDTSVRAREDEGVAEVRSLAVGFNELSETNIALSAQQKHMLAMRELQFDIERAIHRATDPESGFVSLCQVLGAGLNADHVIIYTLDRQGEVGLTSQWSGLGIATLAGPLDAILVDALESSNRLWAGLGRLIVSDVQQPEFQHLRGARELCEMTNARSMILAPIGLVNRVDGIICVVHRGEPRAWTVAEGNVVQQSGVYAAQVVVEAERRLDQAEYVERLEMLDRQKTDFLSTVSHELRTPLTSIGGYLELLQDGDAGEVFPEQSKMLDVIERNTARLRGLIEDILVLNRIETGRLQFTNEHASVRELITHTAEELQPLADRAGVVVDVDAGPASCIVDGDASHLHRAIVNILSNAIKFTPRGGRVSLSCSLDGETARIVCSDQGIGIPAADMKQIFSRFFRARNASAQAIQGTGLGLAIVKMIVENHGGTLDLQSVEGEGTTITLEFPLSDSALPTG